MEGGRGGLGVVGDGGRGGVGMIEDKLVRPIISRPLIPEMGRRFLCLTCIIALSKRPFALLAYLAICKDFALLRFRFAYPPSALKRDRVKKILVPTYAVLSSLCEYVC